MMQAGKAGGKGAKGANNGAHLQQLETQLMNNAWSIYEGLLDLNIGAGKMTNNWNNIMALRGKVLQAYGVPQEKVQLALTPPNPMGAKPGAIQGSAEDPGWKGILYQAMSKKFNQPVKKEDVAYSCTEVAEGWLCTISSAYLQREYTAKTPGPNKKTAEGLAAKAAIEAEFRESLPSAQAAKAPQAAKGQKRPRESAPEMDPKCRLHTGMGLLLGRNLTKDDIVYDTQDMSSVPGSTRYLSTVSVPAYSSATFQAEGESKKSAETKAAQAALDAWNSLIAPLDAERLEKKKIKMQTKLREMKEKAAMTKQLNSGAGNSLS